MKEDRGNKIKVIKSVSLTKALILFYVIFLIIYILFLYDFNVDSSSPHPILMILVQIVIFVLIPITFVLTLMFVKVNDIVLYENGLTPNMGGYDRIVCGKDYFLHFNSIKSIIYVKEESLSSKLKWHRFEIIFEPNNYLPQFADNKDDFDLIIKMYLKSKSTN